MKDDLTYLIIETIYISIALTICCILYKENFIFLSGVFSGVCSVGFLYIVWLHCIESGD